MKSPLLRDTLLPAVSLFLSGATLLCCALPALLVALGLGAALAGVLSAVPQLIWISEQKNVVFIVGGVMLSAAAWLHHVNRQAPCPADPKMARVCRASRRLGAMIIFLSVIVYLIGAFFAYFAAVLLR